MKTRLGNSVTVSKVENYLNENMPTICGISALVAFAFAVYEAFTASEKVAAVKAEYDEKIENVESEDISEDEKARKVKDLKQERNIKYVLAEKKAIAAAAGGTVLGGVSHYLTGSKIAFLSGALVAEKDKVKKLLNSTRQVVGDEKALEIENKVLEEKLDQNFISKDGPVCYSIDHDSDREGDLYFDTALGMVLKWNGTEEELIKTLDEAEDQCIRCHALPAKKYCKFLKIPCPPWIGGYWGPKRPFTARIGKRILRGATFKTIEHDFDPVGPKEAGCPFV